MIITGDKPKYPWKHISENFQEGLAYMDGRRKGLIRSIKTPWAMVDDVGCDGIEWNNIVVIGGRPASGKTLMANQIVRESFELNPGEDFCVLDCQWEMLGRTQAIREFSAKLKKSTKVLNSANKQPLSDEDFEAAVRYARTKNDLPIYTIEKPRTVKQFETLVTQFCEWRKGQKVIVSIDHAFLFKKSDTEDDKYVMLYNLGEALNNMKKELPVMFIVLSQLGRSVEKEHRLKPGSPHNYLLDSDIFGGDALLMYTDILCLINRPLKFNINPYGGEEFYCRPDDLALHFNKVRNGDPRLIFMEAEFQHMLLKEYPLNKFGAHLPPSKKQPYSFSKNSPIQSGTGNLISTVGIS